MTEQGRAEAGENPLVPNAKLRALYVTMLEARRLEETVAARTKGLRKRPATIHGQEAIRASSILQLGDEDLVSDAASTPGMGLILGGDPAALLKAFAQPKAPRPPIARLLPTVDDTRERLELALGAAQALKARGRQGVVAAFVPHGALPLAAWRSILKTASKFELPILLIALPPRTATAKGSLQAVLTPVSGKSGVPGIPVDAADSVALYRVVQESLGRARGGDGPVLIECLLWKASAGKPSDPIEHLQGFLAGRKIATPSWFRKIESSAARRLRARRSASK